uniref:Uncharacterized protein n=1 Tax=Tanacetum cinerariifolium TaxID=118510 RepID=A0A6L2LVF7_TANCI|nr:hypothetical protein [Tanacetum cinerariifolium]
MRLTSFFNAFLVTVDVPEVYMQEFWVTATVHHHAIRFKMDNKKHIINLESFRDMLHICPRLPGQSFVEPPFEEEILAFLRFLGHSAVIRKLTDVNINKLHQPWRSFAAIINKCLTGKSSGYDSFWLSQAQVLLNTKIQRRVMRCIIQGSRRLSSTTSCQRIPRYQGETSSDTLTPSPTAAAGPRLTTSAKGKQVAKASKAKSLSALTEVAMTEAQQLNLATKRSLQQMHISQASGFGADEGTGSKLGVSDVPTDESGEEITWNSTYEEGDDDEVKDDDDNDDGDDNEEGDGDDDDEDNDGEKGNEDDDGDDDDEGDVEKGGDDEQASDEEEFIHPSLSTHTEEEPRDEERHDEEEEEEEEEEEDELYRDVNINQGRGIQTTQEFEDSHVTVTPVNPNGQQQSSSMSSQFVTTIPGIVQRYLDQRINEVVKVAIQIQSDRLRDETQKENDEFLKTIDENIQKIIKEQVKEQVKVQVSKILPTIEQTMNEQLEADVLTRSSYSSKTSYVVAADLSEMELKKILIEKIEGNKSIQRSNEQRNLYKALVEVYESNKIILDTYGETVTLKRHRDDDADKDEEPSAGPDRGSKRRREGKEPESASTPKQKATRSAGRSTQWFKSRQASASESAIADEPMQTTFQMEEPSHPEFDTSAEDQPIIQSSQHPEWFSQQQKPPTPDCDWNKTVDTLTPELLTGPTYEQMKGSCKSQQYPHNLLKPLPLIPDSRGRRVIPFDHFFNNDLEYLRGGASSRKYTTSVTKTKAADYGHIKWIEDLVPRTIWIQQQVGYDMHALWGISHWGRKRQHFYGFTVNRESARDVYSKRRIIAVTELKIIEWHNYKHLDWITVRRDDDKLYKFKEGDFKRLHVQDIEDMLLLLVQGKMTNLTVEERYAFKKKLNLTRLDTYRTDLNRKEAFSAYSNPRGFIYQNKDKKNRLMQIDELHKFSDGTLTDVRTALDDRLKGIQMQYLPKSIWKKSDKDRAATMIQAIDKMLKTRRIMRSLEKFVGGRLYEGDFRMLQKTI